MNVSRRCSPWNTNTNAIHMCALFDPICNQLCQWSVAAQRPLFNLYIFHWTMTYSIFISEANEVYCVTYRKAAPTHGRKSIFHSMHRHRHPRGISSLSSVCRGFLYFFPFELFLIKFVFSQIVFRHCWEKRTGCLCWLRIRVARWRRTHVLYRRF